MSADHAPTDGGRPEPAPDDTLAPGAVVVDREDGEPDLAVVVWCPDLPARDWDVHDRDRTLAEDNPDHPPSADVVGVVFRDDLADVRPRYAGDGPLSPDSVGRGARMYAFPRTRLEEIGRLDAPVGEGRDALAPTNPPTGLVALRDRLEGRAEVGLILRRRRAVLRVEKLDSEYEVHPDGTVDGEGALAGKLGELADQFLGGGGE